MQRKNLKRIICTALACLFLISTGISAVSAADSNTNEAKIYKFLVNNIGFNKAAACGVLSNIYYESNFNPCALGDSGTSFGICQWHGVRYKSLVDFCKEKNYDYKTVEGQLYYLKHELENSYSRVLHYMKNNITNDAQGAYDAGYYWCYNFEIPGDRVYCSVERGQAARYTYWEKYKSLNGNNDTDGIDDIYIESDTDSGNGTPIIIDGPDMPVLGDVNCDKKVTMKDVTDLQMIIAGLLKHNAFGAMAIINGDIDADGELSLSDVVLIQKHIAGLKITV